MRAPVVQSKFTPGYTRGADPRRALDELYANISAVVQAIPTGTIVGRLLITEGSDDAPGWLPLDGREVSRYEYGALYKILGTSAGTPSDDTVFKLPDWRGKFLVGYAADPESSNRVGSGNSVDYTAGAVELPVAYVAWYVRV